MYAALLLPTQPALPTVLVATRYPDGWFFGADSKVGPRDGRNAHYECKVVSIGSFVVMPFGDDSDTGRPGFSYAEQIRTLLNSADTFRQADILLQAITSTQFSGRYSATYIPSPLEEKTHIHRGVSG